LLPILSFIKELISVGIEGENVNNAAKERRQFSIKNIIIIVCILILLATVGLISSYMVFRWSASAHDTSVKMLKNMTAEIDDQVDAFLHLPEYINAFSVKLIENGILDLQNKTEREKFFAGILASQTTEVYSFSYGNEMGEYYGARRNELGIIELMLNNSDTGGFSWYYTVNDDLTSGELAVEAGKFDPRTRPWYSFAKETGKPVFSPIYKHFVMNDLTLSMASPVYNKSGELQGVLGTHIILSNINIFLEMIADRRKGFALIVEQDTGNLIANSLDMPNFNIHEDGALKRKRISDIDNKLIIQAHDYYLATRDAGFLFKNKDGKYYFNYSELYKDGLKWLVISALPQSLLMTAVSSTIIQTIIFVIIGLALTAIIYIHVVNLLFKPINNLIETTEKIFNGDLLQRASIVRNDEIGTLSFSFNKMADKISNSISALEQRTEVINALLVEKEILLKEVHHRIKNSMNIVSSLLSLQARTVSEPGAVSALEDARYRIQSMSVLYDKLYRSADFSELNMKGYLSTLIDEVIANFPNSRCVWTEKNIQEFNFDAKRLQSIGIIINELLTNIMKYAFDGKERGLITVSAMNVNGHVAISVQDDGIGMPESVNLENSTGFGLQLVRALTQQLDGMIRIERGNGTKVVLEFNA